MKQSKQRDLDTEEHAMEEEIERVDRGEDAWTDGEELIDVEIRTPLNVVVPVRLSTDRWSDLHAEARDLGVGPSTLVRIWVFEKLRQLKRDRAVLPAASRKASLTRPRARAPKRRARSVGR